MNEAIYPYGAFCKLHGDVSKEIHNKGFATWIGRKVNKTRIAGLGYVKINPSLWRVIDIHGGEIREVGPLYRTKAELLADFNRYARESWGY